MKLLQKQMIRKNSPPIINQLTLLTLKFNKMKTIKTLFIAILLFNLSINAQITKGNWMVGGSASFASRDYEQGVGTLTGGQNGTINSLNLNPNIGYFIVNNLVVGANIGADYQFGSGNYRTFSTYNIGPFIRYYFLKQEKKFNVLVQGAYHYGTSRSKDVVSYNQNGYNFKTGPVIFLNSSVAFEFLLEYDVLSRENGSFGTNSNKSFQVGLGLQIHLEKNK